jgi:RES domain
LIETTEREWPLPSRDLDQNPLPIETLPEGNPLFRISKTDRSTPIFFGQRQPHRFDVSVGVMYAGLDEHIAFRETILHGRKIVKRLDVDKDERCGLLAQSSISRFFFDRELKLVQAYDDGLLEIGANDNISREDSRLYTQQWSKAFWEHPDRVDGIIYRSRWDENRFCVALYSDRVAGVLSIDSPEPLLGENFRPMLVSITRTYGFKLKRR